MYIEKVQGGTIEGVEKIFQHDDYKGTNWPILIDNLHVAIIEDSYSVPFAGAIQYFANFGKPSIYQVLVEHVVFPKMCQFGLSIKEMLAPIDIALYREGDKNLFDGGLVILAKRLVDNGETRQSKRWWNNFYDELRDTMTRVDYKGNNRWTNEYHIYVQYKHMGKFNGMLFTNFLNLNNFLNHGIDKWYLIDIPFFRWDDDREESKKHINILHAVRDIIHPQTSGWYPKDITDLAEGTMNKDREQLYKGLYQFELHQREEEETPRTAVEQPQEEEQQEQQQEEDPKKEEVAPMEEEEDSEEESEA